MGEDNLNVEGAGAGSGAAESQPNVSNQNQPAIDESAAKLLEALEGRFSSRFEELTKNLTGQLEGLRKVQGDIDRSRNEFRERLAQLNKLTKQGMSQDEAIEALERQEAEKNELTSLRQELAEIKSLIAGNGTGKVQQTVAEVFQKYGLDPKDPAIAPHLAKQYKNAEEMEMAALKVFHQLHTTPNPNPAQSAALNGGEGRRDSKDLSTINDSSTLYHLAAQDMFGG
jgi:predicted XRE-type DNA-binding protein